MSSSEGEEDVVVKLSKLKVNRGYNKDPNDKEDIAEVEGKLYAILSVLDREIASRNYQVSQTSPPPLPTKRLVNLPTLEIPNFTGKYSEYIPFKELFTSVIHNDATLDNIQKLHYLRSFLCSEPLKLIQNLPLSSASYSEAIKMLDDRYNQKFQVISEHINILLDLPHISRSTSIQLREFISQTKQNLAAIKNMKICIDSWDPILICILLRKLDSYTGRAYHMERDPSAEPTVMQLLSFLEKRALALENAEPSPKPSTSGGYGTKQSKFAVNVAAVESKTTCNYCKSTEHKIFSCQKFKILPSVDRFKFIKDQKLCDTCLNKHMGKCRFHFRCDQCKKNHNTLIHLDKMAEPVIMFSSKQTNDILLPTARIKLFTQDNREVHIKAVLDSASQASLVTSKVVSFLGLAPVQNKTNIIGVTDNKSSVKFSVPLEIHSIKTPYSTSINCHVVDTITCRLPQNRIDTSTIEIPAGIELADDEYYLPSDINMLIGADVFFQILEPLSPSPETEQTSSCALQPSPVASPELSARTPAADGPRILNTKFGYIIGGALPSQHEVTKLTSLLCTKCDNNLSNTLASFFQTESIPEVFKEQLSEHEIVENNFQTTVKLENNKFQVDLPLKIPISDVNETLGESFDLAMHRFLSLEKKLQRNSVLHSEYSKFIKEYVELGHGHFVNFDSYNFKQDPIYFLPHHAVVNENSQTTRTRVVFDASMNTRNKLSLNDLLLNGPVVQRELFDIIMLYRFGDYTFNADIKRMFRGVMVNPEHTSLQNILWRENPSESIKCIRLDTVTYGLKTSSYLATRCLLELAKQNETNLPLAADLIKNCTYVDDVMASHSDLNTLLEAKTQLKQLLALGSFELHKWSSNNRDILSDIPISLQQLNDIELQKDNFNIKALGLAININKDCFVIKPPKQTQTTKVTKREILSQISRFYDPLGFVSPIVVKAKVIMQQLWLERMDWDDCPPQHIHDAWVQFSNNLGSMDNIELKRNIQIPSDAEAVQLLGFADASSSTGYGCCVYLRVVHSSGKIATSLLCSKSRINPRTKALTVPRLELNACLLLARLITRVHEIISTKIRVDNVYLFSDSQISLAWLKTEVNKLQAYVSNRVRVVQQLTNGWRWLYVNTHDNPADLVSRGVDDPRALISNPLWWNGPTFLQHREYSFSNKMQLPNDLPELKSHETEFHKTVILITSKQSQLLDSLIQNISDINKMQRILAYILRFCHNCVPTNTKIQTASLSSNELQKALLLLIKHEQRVHFKEEIQCLLNDECIKGSLKPLHPFLDEEGVLRVGGRLHNSDMPYAQKHPIILPKQSKITQLIIRHKHLRLLHAGPKLILAQLNQKYWLVNGIRIIKKVTHKCLVCFRMKANAAKQLMGSLPKQRVTASRAFQVVGIDFAGPVQIKNSRVRRAVVSKGYICVFVCFSTKAVHLELASDLSTDTFLACFKRFISRRSLPTEVFCDNGGAFVGARNKLADLYKLQGSANHQTQVQGFSAQQGITFHFIPAYSPVFAGLAEAAVKSFKYHLKRTIEKSILTYEQLHTVLCQIEAILNSRPIMPISSSDIADFSYLTPGHFLVGGPLVTYPEPDIAEVPINRLKFWTLVENMKQCFWKAWHKQYLNILQSRPKWRDSLPNVTVGSLVILREPNSAPLYWPMARVIRVFPGADNKVRALEVKKSNGKVYTRSLSNICVLPLE